MPANREKLQQLVNALVSGDYAQTTGYLKRTKESKDSETNVEYKPGYCCLGLGCELSGVGEWVEQEFATNAIYVTNPDAVGRTTNYTERYEGSNSPYYFPKPVADWFEIDGKDIEFSWKDKAFQHVRASALNDADCTFAQIAECIAWDYELELPVAVAS